MKLPAFDHGKMQWDAWNAFHVVHKLYAFIQFDTGEFVVCRSSWRPEARHIYKDLHIQIVATDDEGCPPLYVPGFDKPIAKSHLNHKGMQTLLLDLDHKRAVGLGSSWLDLPSIPTRFTGDRRVTAYYAGPDSLPVGAPITRHYPLSLTWDERKHISELVDASKVWLQMQPAPTARVKLEPLKVADFVDVSFSALTTEHRMAIALKGFNTIVKDEHPWLTFNVEGVTEDEMPC